MSCCGRAARRHADGVALSTQRLALRPDILTEFGTGTYVIPSPWSAYVSVLEVVFYGKLFAENRLYGGMSAAARSS